MRGGPMVIMQGAAGFAAFTLLMDAAMGHFGHRPFSWGTIGQ